ncbi:Vacuolar protein-sorting-associated protein 28 [Scheffersomyces spartinae]|uniref:Vacuolar protein sorting-associated protein 28 n=1 Tax=Scheffersomyces spartinae TaxID=45513 RepID=A0A9P7V9A9_9ASCO|nr:Vacuolar protein-sorting-associated protein 28 [Scheffersomyces spartinae]KAG7193592.1 Vacuolar protein-sorting-associated protein 28 [Scheffersomyces spartinae]
MDRNTPLSYAPTSTTAYSTSDNSNVNYHQEISKNQLLKNSIQRSVYEAFAEIYSIVTVLEMIENAFVKDFVTDKEKYTNTSLRLINQYQILSKGILEDPQKLEYAKADLITPLANLPIDLGVDFPDLFCIKYNLTSCSHAVKRLKTGVPLTIEHLSVQLSHAGTGTTTNGGAPTGAANSTGSARLVAEITGSFITIMDALKLNYKTKEQLHPLLSDLVVGLNDLVNNEQALEFHGKSKLVGWLIKLNNLNDSELTEEEISQFLDDLDIAYKGFYTSLS